MDSAQEVELSIVIVNWNTCDLLRECLNSIHRQEMASSFEVIVVDNSSSDGSVDMLASDFSSTHVIRNESNLGFAQANNQGICHSSGKYILLLNSDTVVLPGSLDGMIAFLASNQEVGIVAPRLIYPSGELQPSWAKFPTLFSELLGKNLRDRKPYGHNSRVFLVDWVGGAALMTRREVLSDIGGLDEQIYMYSEETDFCYRAWLAGWKCCYLEDVTIVHLGGGSASRASLRQLQLLYESKLYYFAKHKGAVQTLGLRIVIIAAISFGIVRRIPQAITRSRRGNEQRESIQVRLQLLQRMAAYR